eukprot:1861308-Alexandrium_andersonii.AAC.1
MPPAKLPTDKAVAERYRARMAEPKERRTNGVAVPARKQHAVKMWLIDAGCGRDLVAKAHAVMLKKWIRKAERPI